MLTEHQKEKYDSLFKVLLFNDRVLLKGSAGVGKTYMINEILKGLSTQDSKKILCTAPTNKAVKVIKDKVSSYKATFMTTHSALKLKRYINNKTGREYFKPSFSKKFPPLKGIEYLFVDEASMINSELLEIIEEHASIQKVKVVFIGDQKQINPVGETSSIVFNSGYPTVELTEIVRQAKGNPIIQLSRNLEITSSGNEKLDRDFEGNPKGYMFSKDLPRVVETLAKVNGTDELKYLAWTNAEVNKVNTLVRQRIYGNPSKIEVGETISFNKPYKSYFTNQEIKVKTVKATFGDFSYLYKKSYYGANDEEEWKAINFKYYLINEEDENPIIIVHEDSESDFTKHLNTMVERVKLALIDWKDYFYFKELFADTTYTHALTVHKSQGSTYKQAIVNVQNIKRNRKKEELQRLLYTAVTRASDLVILYNY